MGETPSRFRHGFAGGLLKAATILIMIPFAVNILLLLTGTVQVANSNPPGSELIGFNSFSMVSFNGVISSNTSNSFLVTLQWFPNAFTWSWPGAPSANLTSGILLRGPSTSFDPFTLIGHLPKIFNLPPDEYRCLESHYWPPDEPQACTNPFWTAVLHNRFFRFSTDSSLFALLPFIIHILVALAVFLTLVAEWCIRYQPYWMRCQCWFAWYKSMCPLPKGTKDQIKRMREHEWDRIRLWCYGMVAAYAVLPAVHESFMATMFIMSLRRFDEYLPNGMSVEPRLGRAFLVVAWGSAGASVMALFCVLARWMLTSRRTWIEEQALEQLLDGERGDEEDGT